MYLLAVWHTENETSLTKMNMRDVAAAAEVSESHADAFIARKMDEYDDQLPVSAFLDAIITGGAEVDLREKAPQVFESSDLEWTFVLASTPSRAKIGLVDHMLGEQGGGDSIYN